MHIGGKVIVWKNKILFLYSSFKAFILVIVRLQALYYYAVRFTTFKKPVIVQ